ncbi:TlpA family protein disulfide reductase [Sphingobacterium suaedae]|uniref:TlpA family protein disulfide reductase n=1 Tax=Sphingobacterium suaedae TaxID=1686402 RepID=A0ABW5KKB3_9SPHI
MVAKIKTLICLLFPLLCTAQEIGKPFTVQFDLAGFRNGSKITMTGFGHEGRSYEATLTDGKTTIQGTIVEPSLYILTANPNLRAQIWVESGHIQVLGDSAHFSKIAVLNSGTHEDARPISEQLDPMWKRYDELKAAEAAETDSTKKKNLSAAVDHYYQSIRDVRKHGVFNRKPSFPLMLELYFLRTSLSRDSLQLAFDRFPYVMQNGVTGRFLQKFLQANVIYPGVKAPSFVAKNLEDMDIRLDDFRGKIVLLDFWAAWCAPCRDGNKKLALLYKKYKNDGFEIISFNVDSNKDSWKKASEEDGIYWTNVGDQNATQGETPVAYRVQSLPNMFLLDRDGMVLEVGGSATDIEELLKKNL